MYRFIAILTVLACIPAVAPQQSEARDNDEGGVLADEPVVVAYLPGYRFDGIDAETIELGPVTDLIYFGLSVPRDGKLLASAVPTKHRAPLARMKERFGCRVLLCLGGWERSEHFAEVAQDATRRAALIDSLVKLCRELGFDGVDYDWEHPHGEREELAYAMLIEQTAERFAEHRLLITVAQAGRQNLGPRAYAALDRVHLMCYDHAFPQATMTHARDEVEQLIAWHCPAKKIALGIPFYGRNAERGAISYAQLTQERTFAPGQDELDGYAYNGPNTVAEKTRFALDQGLAGVMVWELSMDAAGDRSLMSVIARIFEEHAAAAE